MKYGKFPFTDLMKDNLVTELYGRGIIEESHKHFIENAPTKKICGVKIIPTLFYGNELMEIRPYQNCVYRIITTSFKLE